MTEQKQLTALVRAMKAALKADHHIEVPYSALRASYLKANGKNPHAFGNAARTPVQIKAALTPVKATHELLEIHTVYLVEDTIGCFEVLALDADGEFPLEEHNSLMQEAKVSAQYAEVPSINRYGLPDYLANASTFYRENFGLELASDYTVEVRDLGDDSGDTCTVDLSLPRGIWLEMLCSALSCKDASAKVSEWVGLHYAKNFDSESKDAKAEWFERYLKSLAEDLNRDLGNAPVSAEADKATGAMPASSTAQEAATAVKGPFPYVEGTFEWVFPDEDSDDTQVQVDRKTGRITFLEAVSSDIESNLVRCRMNCDDNLFDVRFIQLDDNKYWKVRPKDLKEFIAETEGFFNQLSSGDFDHTSIVEASNHGMLGEFSVKSKDGAFELTATYSKHEPDNSNDNARSKGTLSIELAYSKSHLKAKQCVAKRTKPYVFHGDDLGGMLQELFETEELLDLLLKR